MHLYNLTLQPPTAINNAVYGNFSSQKAQEFIVSRGNLLELLRPDDNGKVISICSTCVFGVVRCILPFRLTGGTKDYLVVGSDSGKITILEYLPEKNCFEVRHSETFGKTGCRRITPGQYLAIDPKGRAIMIGAIEKQKLVYVMNRDASNRLTISSPLEAHRSHAIHYAMVGLDVGFENPQFAVLEMDYSDADADPSGEAANEAEKTLVLYELDLGLNHVTRRWSTSIPRSSNTLISVPGGNDGPGGVLVGAENCLVYVHEHGTLLRCFLPRRENMDPLRSLIVISSSTHKQRDLFFVLLQNEVGDIFKVTMEMDDGNVKDLHVKYFDTLPTANHICITKTGFLFVASEFGNHYLFQFQSIGDNDSTAQASALESMKALEETKEENEQILTLSCAKLAPKFTVRKLTNLIRVDEMLSLAPITDLSVGDLAHEDTPQMYALSGRGNRSCMRILRHGLAMTEMAVSELPGHPSSVWCLKKQRSDEFDQYIVVSFQNATLVLSIGETVEEVTDSGFLGTTSTLLVTLLEDDSMLQIHPNGIRHIRPFQPVTEWKAPGKKVIERCAANTRQVVISLAGGELIYFELDDSSGTLLEKVTTELGMEISCLDLGDVPEGRQRCPFLAVGGWDNTARILSLDPNDLMRQRSTQALSAPAETICLVEMPRDGTTTSTAPSDENASGTHENRSIPAPAHQMTLYLLVGLHNGVLQRSEMDHLSGSLSSARSRFLGSTGVKLFRLMVDGNRAVLAISSRSWVSYNTRSMYHLTPLSYERLEAASSFASEQCTEGIVAIAGNTLRIIAIERLGEKFNQQHVPLRYTPRRMIVHEGSNRLILIESDHNQYNLKEKEKLGITNEPQKQPQEDSMEIDEDEEDENENLPICGPIPPTSGQWASCLRVFDPVECSTLSCIEFEENEAAVSIAQVIFHDRGGEVFILVGSIKSLQLHGSTENASSRHEGGYLRVYRLIEGNQLVLLHRTDVEDIPSAICGFQGRVLVGVGNILRIYDLGKKKLLRKCELRNFPTHICRIQTANDRIYVGDLHESFHLLKYKRQENQLVSFADDYIPRFLTCQVLLDYDTIAGGDKFGNVFVCRLPSEVSDEVDNPTGNRILWDTGLLNGAPNKLEHIAQFHVGEVITSMIRTSLVHGGIEALIYTTVMGRVGALIPFSSREDRDFFTNLEMYMRQEAPPLCGRDHLSYRSYYIPVKDVIDGDICEQYLRLPTTKQKSISNDLDRSPTEVLKKLEDLRNRLL